MAIVTIFQIAILIFSIILHEISHGYMADYLGDPTARYVGRLTLNPLKHIELFGSIILPLVTYLAGGFVFGWAKPVPYNPYNLKHRNRDEALVALAGPLSNISIALIFGALIRFGTASLPPSFLDICALIVLINLVLAIFNLVPIPPLDGSKIFFSFLSPNQQGIRNFLERYSMIFLIVFILFLWRPFSSIVSVIFSLITGVSL